MAPAHAPLASSSTEELQLPDVALTYATPANCASVTIAPESELRELLLPSGFRGHLQVVKSDAKKSGCELRVELKSATSEKKGGVFDVATAVDANMVALGKNTYLRSVLGWKELELETMSLQVDNKRYDVLLNGTGGGDKIALSSDMMLYGNKCSSQLMDEALVLRHVIPSGVDAGSLKIRKSDDVAVAEGRELECAVVIGITARAPLLLPGHTEDAMNYLKAFNTNLDDTFDVSDKKRMVATVQLYARESLETTTELLTQDAATAVTGGGGGYSSYNAPSREMAFGIIAGFFGLVTMLAAVLTKKRSHEKQCEERYANASKAAQFRRVSIRMASPTAADSHYAHHARDDFEHEEEEKEEYEEYGEDDGLL